MPNYRNPLGLPYDQRGKPYSRVVKGSPDIGAYEYKAGPRPGTGIFFR